MKSTRFCVFILTTLTGFVTFSQIDTVESKLKVIEGSDRIRYIAESMSLLSTYDRNKAAMYGEEVISNWDVLDISDKEKAKFLYRLGISYAAVSKADSIEILLDRLSELEETPFTKGIRNALLATIKSDESDFSESIKLALEAHRIFSSISDKIYMSNVGYTIAYLSSELGNYEEGLQWINKSLRLTEEIEFQSLEASLLTLKVNIWIQMGKSDSTKILLDKALTLQEELKNRVQIARISNQIGIIEAKASNYDRAYELFYKAKLVHAEMGNMESYIQMVNNIGIVHYYRGDYDSAASAYTNVIETCEEIGDRNNLALGLSNLSNVYNILNKRKEAIELLERSFAIYEEIDSKPGQSRVLNNLGNAYRGLGQLEEAIEYYKRSLVLKEEMGRMSNVAVTLQNMAELYSEIEQFDESYLAYKKSLGLKKELKDKRGMANAYFGLGKLSRELDNPKQIDVYLDSALQIVNEIGFLFLARDIYKYKAELFKERDDFKSAFEAHVLFKTINDSLFTTEKESVFAEVQEQYKTKEQQQQIEILEQKRRNQNQLLAGLAIGGVFLIVMIGLIYNRYRIKNRANRLIEEKSNQLEQSNIELKELSEFKQGMTNMIAHDIKNPLNSIIFLSQKIKDKSGREISKAGEAILRLISNMLDVEKFQDTKPSLQLESILISDLVQEASLSVELLLHDKSIDLIHELESDGKVNVDKDIVLRVLVNLLSNAIKFSPTNDSITLKTNSFNLDSKSYIRLGIEDHGQGIPEEDQKHVFEKFYQSEAKKLGFTASTGLGLTFCQMAIEAHDGSISLYSEKGKGSTFWVTLELFESEDLSANQGAVVALNISKEEQEVLRKYSAKLKELKVHNVGAIMPILDDIDKLDLESNWPAELRSAVKYANTERFASLVEMLD